MSAALCHSTAPDTFSHRKGSSVAAFQPLNAPYNQYYGEMDDGSDEDMIDALDNTAQPYRLTAAQRKYHASITAWTTKMWHAVWIVIEQRRRLGIDATTSGRCWAKTDRAAALSERQQFMAGFAFRTVVAAMPSLPDSDTASVESASSAGDADGNSHEDQ